MRDVVVMSAHKHTIDLLTIEFSAAQWLEQPTSERKVVGLIRS